MTREEFRGALSDIDEGGRLSHSEEARKAEILLLDHDKEQRAEIARLGDDLHIAEQALLSNGYRKECSIPACNCGPQWVHGGHAEERLREIGEAVPYVNGMTILQRVERQMKQAMRLREALREIIEKCEDEDWEYMFGDSIARAKDALKETP